MRLDKLLFIATSLLFVSCAPLVKTVKHDASAGSLPVEESVLVLATNLSVPKGCIYMGSVKVDDSGFSVNCSYPKVIELAKIEVRKAGGNVLKIDWMKGPDLWSTCCRINASIYFMPPVEEYKDTFMMIENEPAKVEDDSYPVDTSNTETKVFVEEMPVFLNGGTKGVNRILMDNLTYPKAALKDKIGGKVIVQFIINPTGYISDVHVEKGLRDDIDKEAIRVVKFLQPWNPGKQNGKNVKVKMTFPINFYPGR